MRRARRSDVSGALAVVQTHAGIYQGCYEIVVDVPPQDSDRRLPVAQLLHGLDRIDGRLVVVAIVAGMIEEPLDVTLPRHEVGYGWAVDFVERGVSLGPLLPTVPLAELEPRARGQGAANSPPRVEVFEGLHVQAGILAFAREAWPTVRWVRGRMGA